MLKFIVFILLSFNFLSTVLAEDTIKIGALFSLSSWGAEGGYQELNGLRLALDDINNSGGINGKQVELVVEDFRSDLKQTVTSFKKLITVDKVPVVIGPNWAEFLEAVSPVANSAEVPVLSPSGYNKTIFIKNKFSFTLMSPHEIAVQPLVEDIIKKGFKTVAVLVSENAYYQGIYEATKLLLKEAGISVEPVISFSTGETNFIPSILKLKKLKPDAIIAYLLEDGSLSKFFKQANEIKLGLPLYSSLGLEYSEIIKKNPEIADGAIYYHYLLVGGAEFLKRYETRFESSPGTASSRAYDSLFIVKNAIEKCGMTSLEIQDCLAKTDYQGISSRIKFDQSGVITGIKHNSELRIVKNGKFLEYSPR
ncbi:MAG: ABC transporter substrate-binding protein [Bdellovibrionota bacterium]